MSYCAYCGGVIQEGAGVRFCPQCGKPVASGSIGPNFASSSGISSGGKWAVYLLVSVFIGFMIATAGLAVFPGLGMISERFLCEGLTVFSQHYSYKPGQSGVTRTFYCPGEVDVSFLVMFYSFLIYTAFSFVAFTALRLVRGVFGKSRG